MFKASLPEIKFYTYKNPQINCEMRLCPGALLTCLFLNPLISSKEANPTVLPGNQGHGS